LAIPAGRRDKTVFIEGGAPLTRSVPWVPRVRPKKQELATHD